MKIELEKVSKRKKVNRKTQFTKMQKYFFFSFGIPFLSKVRKDTLDDIIRKSEMTLCVALKATTNFGRLIKSPRKKRFSLKQKKMIV